ncbi:hypothetical protein TorRG33x02_230700 [Trema orientale]|uniref:Endonuclease/exonuclease/phosphatase n=1 Tax=Trema orientale TaxID=63057 RepID=A0A2P5E6E7_TREOI|nr:hypothetical protein TorRG33x02_230700 [Trema orientale]
MNKRLNNDFIQERLDRYVCSDDWRKLYNTSIIEHGDFISSDHCLLTLWLNKGPDNQDDLSNWDFKFEPYWLQEDGCRAVVEKAWNVHVFSNDALSDFQCKIERCVADLRSWSS